MTNLMSAPAIAKQCWKSVKPKSWGSVGLYQTEFSRVHLAFRIRIGPLQLPSMHSILSALLQAVGLPHCPPGGLRNGTKRPGQRAANPTVAAVSGGQTIARKHAGPRLILPQNLYHHLVVSPASLVCPCKVLKQLKRALLGKVVGESCSIQIFLRFHYRRHIMMLHPPQLGCLSRRGCAEPIGSLVLQRAYGALCILIHLARPASQLIIVALPR
jgi:hypothetical protein